MGRAQLKMEPITCKKARDRTFVKKSHSMIKKARELSILCDVPVLVLVNGPSDSDHYFPTQVWPPDRAMVEGMLWKYLSTNLEARAKGSTGLRHILEARNKKAEKNLEGLMMKHKGKVEGSMVSDRGFDGRYDDVDRMKEMIGCLDRKIEAVKERIQKLKEIKGSDHGVSLPSSSPVVDDGNEIVFHEDEGMDMDDLWDLIDEDTQPTNADPLDIGTHDDVTVKRDDLLSMTGNGLNGYDGQLLVGFDDRSWIKNPMHLDSYYEKNVQNCMWYRQSAIAPSWPQYYETGNDFDGSMGCNVHPFLTNSGLQLQMDDELRLMFV